MSASTQTIVALAIVGDLRLPRPVLSIDERGVFDRRVTDAIIPWSSVSDTSLAPGGGAVQLVLRAPLDSRLSPYRAGTIGFRSDNPGIAVIPLRAMDRPAAEVQRELFGRRIITGTAADPAVLRLLPPLSFSAREADLLLAGLAEVLR